MSKALSESAVAIEDNQDVRDILECTVGVAFLGTPHRGSDKADWGRIVQNVVKATGFDTSDKILRELAVDSALLEDLRRQFAKLLHKPSFRIDTFQEERGFKGVRGLNGKVRRRASKL